MDYFDFKGFKISWDATEFFAHPYDLCLRLQLPPIFEPQPPVKSRERRVGFFSYSHREEYDYHAPKYLKQMKEYEQHMIEQARFDPTNCEIFAPWGTCRIKGDITCKRIGAENERGSDRENA